MFLMQAFHRETLLANSKGNNKKNGPSVRSMLEQVPHQAIASLNNQVLFNTNTPEQWQQAQQKF
jgi:molybdopterin-guanine dinucleotide biosynthesis protein A